MAEKNQQDVFYKRLTSLFRSGPAIQRKIKGQDYKNYYDKSLLQNNLGYRSMSPFGKESSPFSVLGAYGILDRISRYSEFCFHPETLVYTTDGAFTIAELSEKYKNGEIFHVYCYNHTTKKIDISTAHHPRITKDGENQKLIKITFDDGGHVITTLDHKFLLRDGSYIEAKDLEVNTSLMPFYMRKYTGDYHQIYEINKTNNSYGWKPEHVMVAEYFAKRNLNDDEVVHHIDFNPENNSITNLKIMNVYEHKKYHAQLNNKNKLNKQNKNISNYMKNNNPVKRNDITLANIFDTAVSVNFSLNKTMNILKADANVIKRRLREVGYENWIDFREDKESLQKIRIASKIVHEMRDINIDDILNEAKVSKTIYEAASKLNVTENNIRRKLKRFGYGTWSELKNNKKIYNSNSSKHTYDETLTYQKICDAFTNGMTIKQLSQKLNTTPNKIKTRLSNEGHESFVEWSNNYLNHKVLGVELLKEESIVYNITVDGAHNLAVGSLNPNNDKNKDRPYSMVICRQSEMEYVPEIATALNIYADETCASDEKGRAFHVFSENQDVRRELEDLFYDVLNVEFNLRAWTRNLVKYGDFFLFNEVLPEHGVVHASPIPVNEVEREEGWDKEDPYSIRFRWLTRGNKILENWQVTHFRILGNDLFLPYGSSVLEPARRIFRQLIMIEDAMLTYRIVRSPERRVFYIDVGNIAPNDIGSYMEAAKASLRSNSQIDRMNGRQDLRYNPVAIDEDYFIPVRGDAKSTRIESLAGGQHVSATEDVEYIQKKLFSALQIPRAYLGYDESVGSKSTLAQEDVRFSRTINILQKIIIAELNKLAMIHLYAKGFDGEDLINFELFLSNPSSVAVQQKLALWNDRFAIAGKALETGIVEQEWVQKEILGFTTEEVNRSKVKRKEDKLYMSELESIAVQAQKPRESTTDVFDTTNYNVPGSTVAKAPSGNANTQDLSDQEIIGAIRKFDYEGNIIKSETPPGVPPIKATPYATREKRNEKRRVGMGGRDNLLNPDFARSLDYNRSQSLYDITDEEYMSKSIKEQVDEEEIRKSLGVIPDFSHEMKSIFKKMESKFPRKKMEILSEEIDKKLDEEFENKDILEEIDIKI